MKKMNIKNHFNHKMMITKGLYYNTLFTVEQLCGCADLFQAEDCHNDLHIKRRKTIFKLLDTCNGTRDFFFSNTRDVRSISIVTRTGNDYNILEKVWNFDKQEQIRIDYWNGMNCLLNGYAPVYVYIELFNNPAKEFVIEFKFQAVYFDVSNYTLIPYYQRVDDEYCILYTGSDVSKKRYEDTRIGIVNTLGVIALCNKILYSKMVI
jgi:hypothetical protein